MPRVVIAYGTKGEKVIPLYTGSDADAAETAIQLAGHQRKIEIGYLVRNPGWERRFADFLPPKKKEEAPPPPADDDGEGEDTSVGKPADGVDHKGKEPGGQPGAEAGTKDSKAEGQSGDGPEGREGESRTAAKDAAAAKTPPPQGDQPGAPADKSQANARPASGSKPAPASSSSEDDPDDHFGARKGAKGSPGPKPPK